MAAPWVARLGHAAAAARARGRPSPWSAVAAGSIKPGLPAIGPVGWLTWPRRRPDKHPKGRPYPTRDGIWVRSFGEQRIADFLSRRGLAYEYEPPLLGKRPDFLLPGHDVVIEYFGGAGWQRYAGKAAAKVELFEQAGYRVIALVPLNLRELERELEGRLRRMGALA